MSNINFHQTFPPTLEYLTRILEIADMKDSLSKEEISKITGIPTGKVCGKVVPHIRYATYMGLVENISDIKGKYKLVCTPLGNIIKSEDVGLREEVTQLVCHSRLTSPSTGATLWSSIIRDILPKYPEGISGILLQDELMKVQDFGKKQVAMNPFNSTYRKTFKAFTCFSNDKDIMRMIPQNYKQELMYVYAYALLYEWEQMYPGESEISSIQLDNLGIAGTFAFRRETFYRVLQSISEKSIVKINGQLSPFTVIMMSSSKDVQRLLYSLLY